MVSMSVIFGPFFVYNYLVLFAVCLIVYLFVFAFLFPQIQNKKGMDLGGWGGEEDLGEDGGKENGLGIYCIRVFFHQMQP